MSYTSYSTLNNLEEVSFIGGTTFFLDFNIYSDQGIPVGVSTKRFVWRLAPYGDKSAGHILEKTELMGEIVDYDDYTKRVILFPEDTANLSGKYVQQITVEDTLDLSLQPISVFYKPGQGVITIVSNIN